MNKDIIVAKVQLHNYRYPKNKAHSSGEFAIVLLEIKEIIEGSVPSDAYTRYGANTIIVTGNMPRLDYDIDYILQAKLVRDPKWGIQYNSENIRMDYNLDDPKDQRKFLSYFLSENQIDTLFESFDNPLEPLKNNDITSLTKIKGIGPVIANRMCMKYAENIDNGRAYVELKELGLTKYAIDRLIKQFGSADAVVDLIQENPYKLIKLVRGYGWEKADKIALSKGFTTDCKERCIAYAQYRLEKNADDGNSMMSIGELLEEIYNVCAPVDIENLKTYLKEDMINESAFEEIYEKIEKGEKDLKYPTLYFANGIKKVGLFYYRLLERKISRELQRIKTSHDDTNYDLNECNSIIKEVEKEQGFEYTEEQRKAIYSILYNNITILTGAAGCVDKDTEFFDGKQWKKISEYKNGDKVLIYHEDGTASLEEPERYIKEPCDQLWSIKTKYGVDMCLSDEHQVYYITSKGNLNHNTLEYIRNLHEKSSAGFGGKFITTFNPVFGTGIDLSDAEIKVMLAVICDGSFYSHYDNPKKICRFHIKKERKKRELRKIFYEAGLEWREKESATEGYTDFYIYAPRKEKIFGADWYNCTQHQLEVICDNILQWDGSVVQGRKTFSSNTKENADFVQYAFSACGYRTTISENDRRGTLKSSNNKIYERKSIDYHVSITERNLITIGGFHKDNPAKTKFVPYESLDGYKYCFTVSTHMWIMRRNGRIMITGNCGKSSTVKPLIKIFEKYNKTVAQCALSGRAASLLTEYTGLEGKTIHRLLRYDPEIDGFVCNKNNQLDYDVIILDETSMVGEELFLNLIESIRSGSKLIMLGDVKQLPPMSVGNLLSDCMSSGYVPTNMLTKIHRQALKSGIISQSLAVCEGKNIAKAGSSEEEVRGELQDFKIVTNTEPILVHSKAMDQFKILLDKGISSDDIQVVVPVRSRGMNSCRYFNAEIQALVNPDKGEGVEVDTVDNGSHFVVTYRPGDKIMIIQNNYHARTITGRQEAIFNGNMGYICSIDKDSMVLQIEGHNKIILPKEQWGTITHGWACTCHKLQGSQANYIIVCVDNSAYTLLIREWLYTALTRAKKYCVLVGQSSAINSACRTSNIKVKQTWLRGELQEMFMRENE